MVIGSPFLLMPYPFDLLPSFNWLIFVRPHFFLDTWRCSRPVLSIPCPRSRTHHFSRRPGSFHQRKTFRNQAGGAECSLTLGMPALGSQWTDLGNHVCFSPAYIQVSMNLCINRNICVSEGESILKSPALIQHQRVHSCPHPGLSTICLPDSEQPGPNVHNLLIYLFKWCQDCRPVSL